MDLTVIIQVEIGVIVVWVILAMIASQVQEWISSILSWRADMLEDANAYVGQPGVESAVLWTSTD